MDKITFQTEKEKLKNFAIEQLSKPKQTKFNTESLTDLITLLDKYTYENRLRLKGLMIHAIIDSLIFDDRSLVSRFIDFDNAIT